MTKGKSGDLRGIRIRRTIAMWGGYRWQKRLRTNTRALE
jgi:hypothetical protein